jgi:MFS transporter, DHA1 family, multidrug resistance protein
MSPGLVAPSPWLVVLIGALAMVGAFASDAVLPAFPSIGAGLAATPVQVQQSLTVFLIAYAAMNLWHGALSDAFGRRAVIGTALFGFMLASIGCALAPSIEILIFCRALQGLCAGAGQVVGRAVVRDLYSGSQAQQQLARVSMLFAIAPVAAPLLGGLLVNWSGWRAVFYGLAALSLLLLIFAMTLLPETLARGARIALHPVALARVYGQVLRDRQVRRFAVAIACAQSAMFISIAGAPAIIMGHYKLAVTDFHWQFGPLVAGLFLGGALSSRLAGRMAPVRQLGFGFLLMAVAAMAEFLFAATATVVLPWNFAPLFVYALGLMIVIPVFSSRMLDAMPQIAGTVSSCQSFVQGVGLTLVSGLVVPAVSYSLIAIALAKLLILGLAYLSWGRR